MSRVLAVRLDSDGDVLLTGPALRVLAGTATRLDLLASPAGRRAALLLPGVHEVLDFDPPWSGHPPARVDPASVSALISRLRERRYDRAIIFTSFHQSPLPMALIARLAGIGFVAATSVDYPGSLLDVRHQRRDGLHEVEAAIALAVAAGGRPGRDDDGRLAVRGPLPDVGALVPSEPYVVLHPGASAPARAISPGHAHAIAASLAQAGWQVLVTGTADEMPCTSQVAGGHPEGVPVIDLSGRTSFAQLAAVLAGAGCAVVGNTGPAHLAAAVGAPVVSLFSPVVRAEQWAPYGVPVELLGDQWAPCRDTRALECPVPGHPCLSQVSPLEVTRAVGRVARFAPRSSPTARVTAGR